MRIHTDTLSYNDVFEAARIARVDLVVIDRKGSRKRDHAFEVKLEGESRRRPNGGSSGAGSGYAATWDQWGVFLAVLFERDPNAVSWAYDGQADFDYRTSYRFEGDVWPEDAHGDHAFRFSGTPGAQRCTKCSATRRWL